MSKPVPYRQSLTLKNAAHLAFTTPKKMRECLTALGVRVDDKDTFHLDTLLYAVRVNLDPKRSRDACRRAVGATMRRVFGPPLPTGKKPAAEARP